VHLTPLTTYGLDWEATDSTVYNLLVTGNVGTSLYSSHSSTFIHPHLQDAQILLQDNAGSTYIGAEFDGLQHIGAYLNASGAQLSNSTWVYPNPFAGITDIYASSNVSTLGIWGERCPLYEFPGASYTHFANYSFVFDGNLTNFPPTSWELHGMTNCSNSSISESEQTNSTNLPRQQRWLTALYAGTVSTNSGTIITLGPTNQQEYFTGAVLNLTTAPVGCSTYVILALYDTTASKVIAQSTVASGTYTYTMTIVNNIVPAGDTLTLRITQPASGCSTNATYPQVVAQYY
jgi:hypothetical protein